MAGRRCVTYVNFWPPVRGIVFVQYQVLTPGPCPQARARPAREGVRPSEAGERGGWRLARAGTGKAAGGDGKGRGRTVISSAAASEGMPGIGAEIGYFEAARR